MARSNCACIAEATARACAATMNASMTSVRTETSHRRSGALPRTVVVGAANICALCQIRADCRRRRIYAQRKLEGLPRLLIFRRAWFYRLAIHSGRNKLMRHSGRPRARLLASSIAIWRPMVSKPPRGQRPTVGKQDAVDPAR
jgi:hypothetical protein